MCGLACNSHRQGVTDADETSGSEGGPSCPSLLGYYGEELFTCAQGVTCDESLGFECGPLALFTEEGCLRAACRTDADCGAEERCYLPVQEGKTGCASSHISCHMHDAVCECIWSNDCANYIGWCVAAADLEG